MAGTIITQGASPVSSSYSDAYQARILADVALMGVPATARKHELPARTIFRWLKAASPTALTPLEKRVLAEAQSLLVAEKRGVGIDDVLGMSPEQEGAFMRFAATNERDRRWLEPTLRFRRAVAEAVGILRGAA